MLNFMSITAVDYWGDGLIIGYTRRIKHAAALIYYILICIMTFYLQSNGNNKMMSTDFLRTKIPNYVSLTKSYLKNLMAAQTWNTTQWCRQNYGWIIHKKLFFPLKNEVNINLVLRFLTIAMSATW